MNYTIADTHFGHENIIEYENRPFPNSKEMDKVLINRWNNTVNKDDTVYHLGNVFLCNTERQFEIMDQLNGYIILIRGNHDHQTDTKLIDRLGFQEVYDSLVLKDKYILTHRPIECNNNYFNIHGHTHSQRENDTNHYCVSVEVIGYKPIRLDKIIKREDYNERSKIT